MITIDQFRLKVEKSIKYADDKSDIYRAVFYVIRIGFIVITGLITVFSGLQGVSDKEYILNSVLILGAVVTALTSCDTLFQIETKKNVYKLMKVELKEIRNEINIHLDDAEKLQILINDVLYPKYLNIMAYSKIFIEKSDESV